jgi:hypothetical protein
MDVAKSQAATMKKESDDLEKAKKDLDSKVEKMEQKKTYSQGDLDARVNIAATHAATDAIMKFKGESSKGKKEIKDMDKDLKKTLKKTAIVDDSDIKLKVAIKKAAIKKESKPFVVKKPHAKDANGLIEAMSAMAGDPAAHGLNTNAAEGVGLAAEALSKHRSYVHA